MDLTPKYFFTDGYGRFFEEKLVGKYRVPSLLFLLLVAFVLHKWGFELLCSFLIGLERLFNNSFFSAHSAYINYIAKAGIFLVNIFLIPLLVHFLFVSVRRTIVAFGLTVLVYLLALISGLVIKMIGLREIDEIWKTFIDYLSQGLIFFLPPALSLLPKGTARTRA